MRRLRLVKIKEASFKLGVPKLWAAHVDGPFARKMGVGDVVYLISKGGDQLIFLFKPLQVGEGADTIAGAKTTAYRSERIQLSDRRPFNPYMLQDYARQVGLDLAGIPSFQEHYTRLRGQVLAATSDR